MADNLQQNAEQQKGPFSPLQTGCAVVMLTNMLIYLGVVLFTFNLLDPSKIDASYLAKRGFTALPEPKNEQDTAFQQLSQQKRAQQKQIQTEMATTENQGLRTEPSAAVRLSQIEQPRLGSSRPEEAERPKAALTTSSRCSGGGSIRATPTRRYSISIYPQVTLPQSYSPVRIPTPKTIVLETYETVPVEMASGINSPAFSLPSFDFAGPYLYRPANPIPEASRGGLKLSSPSIGAESLYTNGTKKIKAPPAKKPSEKPPEKDKL